MRKMLLSLLAVAVLLGTCSLQPAEAAELKPVAVATFAGYDELLGNIKFVGELSDLPRLATRFEAALTFITGSPDLAGLNKKKPWGVVVQTDGEEFLGYGLLPVTDLKELLDGLRPFLEDVTEGDDGVYELKTKDGKSFYAKEKKGGWALVGDRPDVLARAAKVRIRALGKLNKKYDLAVRLYAANVPEKYREMAIAKIEADAKKDLEQKPEESDEQYAVRKKFAAQAIKSITAAVNDVDQVTLGWSLDPEAQKTYLDVTVTARPGTETAEELAALTKTTTKFAGFRLPGATLTGILAGKAPPVDTSELSAVMEMVRTQAFREADQKDQPKEKTELEKRVVGGLLDVIEAMVAEGRVDAGWAVTLKPDVATLVAGMFVVDAKKVEETLTELVEAVRKEEPKLVEKALKMDAAEHKGIRFHTVSIPIPDDADNREKVVRMIGETLEVVVGIGKQSVYVSAGTDAMKTLTGAIDASLAEGVKKVPPMQITLSLGSLTKFIAEMGDTEEEREKAAKAAAVLEEAGDKDHVHLVATPIDRGVRLRLELEEGILKLIGKALSEVPGLGGPKASRGSSRPIGVTASS